MFGKILVPVDFTEKNEAAIQGEFLSPMDATADAVATLDRS